MGDNVEPVPSEQRSSGWKQQGGVQMSAWDSDSLYAECVLSHVQAELCLSVLGGLAQDPHGYRSPYMLMRLPYIEPTRIPYARSSLAITYNTSGSEQLRYCMEGNDDKKKKPVSLSVQIRFPPQGCTCLSHHSRSENKPVSFDLSLAMLSSSLAYVWEVDG